MLRCVLGFVFSLKIHAACDSRKFDLIGPLIAGFVDPVTKVSKVDTVKTGEFFWAPPGEPIWQYWFWPV